MGSLFSISSSGRGKVTRKPRLEVLEDRNLLAVWTNVAPMLVPQGELAGALSAQGLVYAIGGTSSYPVPISTVEAYNPNADSWSLKASLNVPRLGLGAATGLDGKIYAIGGGTFTGADIPALATTEAYSAFANTWTVVAPMPTPRIFPAVVTGGNGLIYAIGGATSGTAFGVALSTVQAYSTQTGSWSTRASLPLAVQGAAAAVGPDGRIYVFGGVSNASFPLVVSTVQVYSPFTNTWSFGTPMPTATAFSAAAQGPNGRIFVIAGSTNWFFGSEINPVQSYNTATGTWTVVPISGPTPTATRGEMAATLPYTGDILAYGGINNAGASLTTNQALSNVGGFAASGLVKSHDAALDVVDPSMLSTTATVSPLSNGVDQGAASDSGASDSVAPQVAVDTVFADDNLSVGLADTLV
jgi:N-acetylneuraminic acid mutarotase